MIKRPLIECDSESQKKLQRIREDDPDVVLEDTVEQQEYAVAHADAFRRESNTDERDPPGKIMFWNMWGWKYFCAPHKYDRLWCRMHHPNLSGECVHCAVKVD